MPVLLLTFIVPRPWLALKNISLLPGVPSCHTTYAFETLTTPEAPGVPCVPLNPGGPCGPCGPCGPWAPSSPSVPSAPGGPCGPCVPVRLLLSLSLSLSLSNLNLQNSTEDTKNPSNGPVQHSYLFSSVGYVL